MDAFLLLMGILVIALLGVRWLYRRQRDVDDFYEREPLDLPVTDFGSWFGRR